MCDDDADAGGMVDELLDLELHHFMQLLATDKTKARVEYAEEWEAIEELRLV